MKEKSLILPLIFFFLKDDVNGPHLRITKGSRESTCHKKEKVIVLLFYPRIWPVILELATTPATSQEVHKQSIHS